MDTYYKSKKYRRTRPSARAGSRAGAQRKGSAYAETFFVQMVMSGIFFAAIIIISLLPATQHIKGAIKYAVSNNAALSDYVVGALPQGLTSVAEDIREMVFGPAYTPLLEQPQPLPQAMPQPQPEPAREDFRIDEDILREMSQDEKKYLTDHQSP